jgi:hypothetical protein
MRSQRLLVCGADLVGGNLVGGHIAEHAEQQSIGRVDGACTKHMSLEAVFFIHGICEIGSARDAGRTGKGCRAGLY